MIEFRVEGCWKFFQKFIRFISTFFNFQCLIQNCVEFFCFGVILSYITQIWKFKSQSSLEKLEESKYTKKKSLLIAKKKKKLQIAKKKQKVADRKKKVLQIERKEKKNIATKISRI